VTSEYYQFVVTVEMKNCDPFVFLSIISYHSDFRKRNSGNRYNAFLKGHIILLSLSLLLYTHRKLSVVYS
jgi:hypothetical protein